MESLPSIQTNTSDKPNTIKFKTIFLQNKYRKITSNPQSILFNKQNSLAILKAYHKRKILQLRQSIDEQINQRVKQYQSLTIQNCQKYRSQIKLPQIDLRQNKNRFQRSSANSMILQSRQLSVKQSSSKNPTPKTPQQSVSPTKTICHQPTHQLKLLTPSIPSKLLKSKLKCYMNYHPQAKQFLIKHKDNLMIEPKIKEFFITGITAKSYAVLDIQTLTPIVCRRFNKNIQIASITKVMTCYLCILACEKYHIDVKTHKVKVNQIAAQMPGTSAELQTGDVLTIQQLLYGLMLPSGNDAAMMIAQAIGKTIQRHKQKQTKKSYLQTFIAHMNILSREVSLSQSWQNPSGLPSPANFSNPLSTSVLTSLALLHPYFLQISATKEYSLQIKNQRTGLSRKVIWKNTNKLLEEGWEAGKTGMTDRAGACLIVKRGRLLVAVYDSKNNHTRFQECKQLYQFVMQRHRIIFPENWT